MGPTDKMGDNSNDYRVWKEFPPSSFADTAGKAYKRWYSGAKHLASTLSSEAHANYVNGGVCEPTQDYHSILHSNIFQKWWSLVESVVISDADAERIEFPFYHDPPSLELGLLAHVESSKCFEGKFYPAYDSPACRNVLEGYGSFLKESNLDHHRLGSASSDGRGNRVGNSLFFTPEGMDGIAGPNLSDRITDAIKAFEFPTTSSTDRLRLWQGIKFMLEYATYNMSEDMSDHICHTTKDTGPITLHVGKGAAGCAKALKFLSVGYDVEPAAYTFESAMKFFETRKGNTDLVRKIFGEPIIAKKDKLIIAKPDKGSGKKRKVRIPTPPHRFHSSISCFHIVLPTCTDRSVGGSRLSGRRGEASLF